jgi:4'-phosphopantetheinyl transferase
MNVAGAPWGPPPDQPRPNRGEVHVWRAALDLPTAVSGRLTWVLSPEERERARRLHLSRDRDRFVVRRFVLRSILARYVGARPEALRFRYGGRGKPALAVQDGPGTIRFNVSSSGGLAVYSVAQARETGVDIERVRGGLGGRAIAEWFFSGADRAMLQAVPAELYDRAFLVCWTRLEAYVKGTGEGLAGAHRAGSEASGWVVQDVAAGPGYVGALAVEGADWTLRSWEWNADD